MCAFFLPEAVWALKVRFNYYFKNILTITYIFHWLKLSCLSARLCIEVNCKSLPGRWAREERARAAVARTHLEQRRNDLRRVLLEKLRHFLEAARGGSEEQTWGGGGF